MLKLPKPIYDSRDPERFHIHMTSVHKFHFAYVFQDRGETIETGSASTPRVIYILFEEFKRGRLSAD